MFDSSWSSMCKDAGSWLLIWRHSSWPIDPPAPVTRTRAPASMACTDGSRIRRSARPSRSLKLTVRMSAARAARSRAERKDGR